MDNMNTISGRNVAVLMLLIMNSQVQAILMSRTPTGVHHHLARCIRSISERYFTQHRSLMISLSGCTCLKEHKLERPSTCQRHFNDVHNDLAKELHGVGRWSMVLSNRTERIIDRNDYMKHGSYILLVCWKSVNGVPDINVDFNKHLQNLSNTSSWNPEARLLVVVQQECSSHDTGVLVRSLLQELWHFKVINSVILLQICERDDHKVREHSSELLSTKILHPEHQEYNGHESKGLPCLVTEFDGSNKCDKQIAFSTKGNKIADYSALNKAVFRLYTWIPYQNSDRCTEVLDIAELDLWSSEGHGGFLYNYPLFPPKIFSDLEGCPIFILTAEYPPFVVSVPHVTPNTSKKLVFEEGPVMRLLKTVSSKMNMTENITGVETDRVFPELFTKIKDGKFDVLFSPLSLLHFGKTFLDETYVLSQKRGRFVVPCGQTFARWNSVIRVFSPDLWLTVFLSMLIACILMLCLTSCLNKLSQSEYQVYQRLSSCLISMWAVLLGLSVSVMPRADIFRVFFSTWLIYCLAVNTVFQAFLTTFLINPGRERHIQSIQELLSSGLPYGFDPQCDKTFNDTEEIVMRTILQHRIPCSPYTTCMDWVAYHRNFSTPSTDNIVDYFITTKYVDYQGQPLLCTLKEEYYSSNNVIHMMKGNPLFQRVNEIVGRIVESGIFNQWTKEFFDSLKLKKGVISLRTLQDEYYNLNLEHIQSAFWVLCVGLGLGIAVFVAQLCFPQRLLQSGKYLNNRSSSTFTNSPNRVLCPLF